MDDPAENGKDDLLSRIIDAVITSFFFIILMLTILLVILRYVFNSSIIGGNELMEYLFIYTTALGAALAVGKREHIKIMFFVDKLPPVLRTAALVLGLLLVAFINIVIFRLSFPWMMKVGMSESPVMRVPMWAIQISVPLGCGLVVFYCIFDSWKIIRAYRSGKGVARW